MNLIRTIEIEKLVNKYFSKKVEENYTKEISNEIQNDINNQLKKYLPEEDAFAEANKYSKEYLKEGLSQFFISSMNATKDFVKIYKLKDETQEYDPKGEELRNNILKIHKKYKTFNKKLFLVPVLNEEIFELILKYNFDSAEELLGMGKELTEFAQNQKNIAGPYQGEEQTILEIETIIEDMNENPNGINAMNFNVYTKFMPKVANIILGDLYKKDETEEYLKNHPNASFHQGE